MFGIGGGELLVVALVALLVLGPEKLPGAARTAGRVYARLGRILAEARAVMKTEMDLAALDQQPSAERRPSPPASGSDSAAPGLE